LVRRGCLGVKSLLEPLEAGTLSDLDESVGCGAGQQDVHDGVGPAVEDAVVNEVRGLVVVHVSLPGEDEGEVLQQLDEGRDFARSAVRPHVALVGLARDDADGGHEESVVEAGNDDGEEDTEGEGLPGVVDVGLTGHVAAVLMVILEEVHFGGVTEPVHETGNHIAGENHEEETNAEAGDVHNDVVFGCTPALESVVDNDHPLPEEKRVGKVNNGHMPPLVSLTLSRGRSVKASSEVYALKTESESENESHCH